MGHDGGTRRPRWVPLLCECGRTLGKWEWRRRRGEHEHDEYRWSAGSVPPWSSIVVRNLQAGLAGLRWQVSCAACGAGGEFGEDQTYELLSRIADGEQLEAITLGPLVDQHDRRGREWDARKLVCDKLGWAALEIDEATFRRVLDEQLDRQDVA